MLLKDNISLKKDTIAVPKPGIWARTEVVVGRGYNHNRLGKSYLDEVDFTESNTVPIGGVQFVFEQLFGVSGESGSAGIPIPTLYSTEQIGVHDEAATTEACIYETPSLNDGGGQVHKHTPYKPGHFVQLFGVGVTGTAENNITVHKVGYRENSITMSIQTDSADGTLDGAMYPFRFTDSTLSEVDRQKYFGKKYNAPSGKTGYYLKRFEQDPEIKHIWKTSDTMDTENEIRVTQGTVWDYGRNDAVESFIECHLRITKNDIKEYFEYIGQPESCRINCIALYNGFYTEAYKAESDQFGDYQNIKLFSKLNIPTEHLSLQKDLEILYRIYGS